MSIINDIEKEFAITILPVEIKGNRWSCVNNVSHDLPLAQPFRVRVSERNGYIIYPQKNFDEKKRLQLEERLKIAGV